MLLPLLIIIIASAATYFAWHSAHTTMEKSVTVAGYVVVLAICYKYISLARVSAGVMESFDVEMPNVDEMLDEERDIAAQNSGSNKATNKNNSTSTSTGNNAEPETEATRPVAPKKTPVEFIRVDDAKRFGEEQLTGLAPMSKGVDGPRTIFPTTESTDVRNNRNNLNNKVGAERFKGDLPGATSRSVDHMPFREETEHFNNISQEKTDGMSSVFNPQIIINNPPGGGSTTGDGSSPFVDEYTTRGDVDRFTGGSHQSSKSNLPKSTIQSYLEPKQDIFNRSQQANDFQDTDAEQAWKWMSKFIAKNRAGPNSSANNNNSATSGGQSSCSVARPYAEENGKFNTATLNNRSFVPGMSYLPPTEWSVPQYHPTYCRSVCPVSNPNTRELPIGIMDHGTPVFALEIGSDGNIAKTEEEVTLTNVGSICPKFVYREYVECPSKLYMGKPTPDTITKPSAGNNNKGSNATPPEVFNKEPPAGTKFMDGWVATIYTEEQQARLGVDEFGNPKKA